MIQSFMAQNKMPPKRMLTLENLRHGAQTLHMQKPRNHDQYQTILVNLNLNSNAFDLFLLN